MLGIWTVIEWFFKVMLDIDDYRLFFVAVKFENQRLKDYHRDDYIYLVEWISGFLMRFMD